MGELQPPTVFEEIRIRFSDLGSKIIIRLQVQAVRFAFFFPVVLGKSGRLFCFK